MLHGWMNWSLNKVVLQNVIYYRFVLEATGLERQEGDKKPYHGVRIILQNNSMNFCRILDIHNLNFSDTLQNTRNFYDPSWPGGGGGNLMGSLQSQALVSYFQSSDTLQNTRNFYDPSWPGGGGGNLMGSLQSQALVSYFQSSNHNNIISNKRKSSPFRNIGT